MADTTTDITSGSTAEPATDGASLVGERPADSALAGLKEKGSSCPQCGAPVDLPGYLDLITCRSCGSTLARQRAFRTRPRTLRDAVGGDARVHVDGVGLRSDVDSGASADEAPVAVLRSVGCSQCAGPLAAKPGQRILVCGHCGVRTVVTEHAGFSRWYFPCRVDRESAAAAAARWLKEHPGIARRARKAAMMDATLLYVPIWEHRAIVAGWEFGHKMRTRTQLIGEGDNERLDLQLVREGVEEPRLQERRFYQAAADLEAIGVTRPRVTGREAALPLLAGELEPSVTILEARGAPEEVAERGRRAAMVPLSGAVAPDAHLFTLRERITLLYYPLWLLHYRAGNAIHRVVVNGRAGNVNSATAPADESGRLAKKAGRLLGAAILVGVLVWLAVASDQARVPALVAAVIVSLVAGTIVTRSGAEREVEYHEPFSS